LTTRRISGYDISVLVLDSPFSLNSNVRPARIFTSFFGNNIRLTASGWGETETGNPPSRLKFVSPK